MPNKEGGSESGNSNNWIPFQPQKSESERFTENLKRIGLDTNKEYYYWPLVYGPDNGTERSITGEILNYGDRRVERIMVTYDLYDMYDRKVGTAWDFMSDLGPGERWAFKAVTFTDYSKYKGPFIKCMDITGDPRH